MNNKKISSSKLNAFDVNTTISELLLFPHFHENIIFHIDVSYIITTNENVEVSVLLF